MQGAGFLLLILSVVKNSAVPIATHYLNSEDVFKIKPDIINNNGNQASLSGVLFKTVMRYHCLPPSLNDGSSIILYGSNGWTFPEQDVNLTLSYPTSDVEIRRNFDKDLIAGYEVLLFTDSTQCTGSIASGGLMRNHITLNFALSGITMLSYEFWLYGVPGGLTGAGGGKAHQNYNLMC